MHFILSRFELTSIRFEYADLGLLSQSCNVYLLTALRTGLGGWLISFG